MTSTNTPRELVSPTGLQKVVARTAGVLCGSARWRSLWRWPLSSSPTAIHASSAKTTSSTSPSRDLSADRRPCADARADRGRFRPFSRLQHGADQLISSTVMVAVLGIYPGAPWLAVTAGFVGTIGVPRLRRCVQRLRRRRAAGEPIHCNAGDNLDLPGRHTDGEPGHAGGRPSRALHVHPRLGFRGQCSGGGLHHGAHRGRHLCPDELEASGATSTRRVPIRGSPDRRHFSKDDARPHLPAVRRAQRGAGYLLPRAFPRASRCSAANIRCARSRPPLLAAAPCEGARARSAASSWG